MPSLSNHQSNDFVKLLLLGDSKSGKTGSLVSLVKAGYDLRILDFDNLLDSLKYQILNQCPDRLSSVEFRTLRDEIKVGPKGSEVAKPRAWIESLKMLNRWKYDDVDLGDPGEWGSNVILVIDSLSRWCDAAYDFHESVIPVGRSGDYDGRAVYGNSQDDVEKQLGALTAPSFKTNVIVVAHGIYQDQADGTTKIFPQSVGQKLCPRIPQYFPNYIRYKNIGGKRTIQLTSDPMIDLANTNPAVLDKTLPIEDGLATFFAALRAPPVKERPKALTLKRI